MFIVKTSSIIQINYQFIAKPIKFAIPSQITMISNQLEIAQIIHNYTTNIFAVRIKTSKSRQG